MFSKNRRDLCACGGLLLWLVSKLSVFLLSPCTDLTSLVSVIVSGTSSWGCFSTLGPRSTPSAGLGLTLRQSCFCQVVTGLVINCVEEGKAQWSFPPLTLLWILVWGEGNQAREAPWPLTWALWLTVVQKSDVPFSLCTAWVVLAPGVGCEPKAG